MHNSAYVSDNGDTSDTNRNTVADPENGYSKGDQVDTVSETTGDRVNNNQQPERENWGKGIEFLMSCIAMSVGLGNVWRFPFTALENGGGAFLLPYIIVLLVIGRPLYYLEMVLGQFSSKSSIKVYNISPVFRGAGYGQFVAIFLVSTYYASIMALIGRYLFDSFKSPLPWMNCRPEWVNCIDANGNISNGTNPGNSSLFYNASSPIMFDVNGNPQQLITSSEYYFVKEVLQEADGIENGLGTPILNLSIFLLVAWIFITGVLIKGIRSSGKASYFLAIFPYVIIFILLIRAVTLPGAWNGILFFIRPRWDMILEPGVWYAAVVQCFFSLAVGFGNIIMYSSFNKFNHNVYRDATIVTTLDTFTSLLAGCTIFGILGHLAHEMGTEDIASVIKGGPGMAFISYPDAIARFDFLPQMFSILFFFMLFVLGIGSNIAMCSCIVTAIRDQFPKLKPWQTIIPVALVGFSVGLLYTTPGGQWALTLVDFFGTSFIVFMLAIFEIIAVSWVYGVDRLCRDIEFMINRQTGLYWRLCWGLLTPLFLIAILLYTFVTYTPLIYDGKPFPSWAYGIGWSISVLGVIQLPIWGFATVVRQKGHGCQEKLVNSFRPQADWGPSNPAKFEEYQKFINSYESQRELLPGGNLFVRIKRNIFG